MKSNDLAHASLGNLGLGGRMDGERTRVLVEQYVELCESMQQKSALTGALHRLGAIASIHGDYDKAEGYFKNAIEMAKEQGNRQAEKQRVSIVASRSAAQKWTSTSSSF